MQNKLVNTDESINIDELEKSKTISLTSNRSPVCIYEGSFGAKILRDDCTLNLTYAYIFR